MPTNPGASLPSDGQLYSGLYFGAMLSTALYGITCMQTFFYYTHYENDPMRMKVFVAVLWALNSIHEVLSVFGVYKYVIAGIDTPSSAMEWSPELTLLLLFTATVAAPVQGFFIHRIYIFSGRNIIAPLLWAPLAIVHLGCAIIYVGKALYITNGVIHVVELFVQSDYTYATLVVLSLAISGAVDILIAIFMTLLLVRHRDLVSYAGTAHLLQRLVVFAVNTGIWTATFAFLTLILLCLSSINTLYAVPGMPLCSVYCNTLLANLNVRSYIGGRETMHISSIGDLDIELATIPGVRMSANTHNNERPRELGMLSSAQQSQRVGRSVEESILADSNRSTLSFVSKLTRMGSDNENPAC